MQMKFQFPNVCVPSLRLFNSRDKVLKNGPSENF